MGAIVTDQTELIVRALSFFVSFLPPFALALIRFKPLAAVLAVWYAVAYYLSRQEFLHELGVWHNDDTVGFFVFANVPVAPLIAFYAWYKQSPAFRAFLFESVPPWGFALIQVYRLGGLAYLEMRSNGSFPDYFGAQVGLLDGFMGVTAVPLALYIYKVGLGNCRNLVYIWHVVGMYDLVSAFSATFASFFGLVTMSIAPTGMAKFPMTLVIFFQVPLAIMIHGLFLMDIDRIITVRGAKEAARAAAKTQ